MSSQKPPVKDFDIADPAHWKGLLVVGLIGLATCILVGSIFGIGPVDVILLKEPALALFQIGDYLLIGLGLIQAVRYALHGES